MATQQDGYSVSTAYALGDQCNENIAKDKDNEIQWFLAATLCYLLVTVPGRDGNQPQFIDHQKLPDLELIKQKYNLIITPQIKVRIPEDPDYDVLSLLKAFYALWLVQIKQHLKKRNSTRINEREKAFKAVFGKFSNESLDVSEDKSLISQRHDDHIDKWDGPDYQHLKIEENKRGKNKYSLTVVQEFEGYKKRCCNSQEGWSKKYDGQFVAICINKASKILGRNQVLKQQFLKALLHEKVKFKCARKTNLIPNSWMFDGKNCVVLTAMIDLLGINKAALMETGNMKQKRDELVGLCEQRYNVYLDVKDDNNTDPDISMLRSPSNLSNISIASSGDNQLQVNANNTYWSQSRANDSGNSMLRFSPNISIENTSMESSDGNQSRVNIRNDNYCDASYPQTENNETKQDHISMLSRSSNIPMRNTSNLPNISIPYTSFTAVSDNRYGQNRYNNNHSVRVPSPIPSIATGTNTSTPFGSTPFTLTPFTSTSCTSTPFISTPLVSTPYSNTDQYNLGIPTDHTNCPPNARSQGINLSNNKNEQNNCDEVYNHNQVNQPQYIHNNQFDPQQHHQRTTQQHPEYPNDGQNNNNNNYNMNNQQFVSIPCTDADQYNLTIPTDTSKSAPNIQSQGINILNNNNKQKSCDGIYSDTPINQPQYINNSQMDQQQLHQWSTPQQKHYNNYIVNDQQFGSVACNYSYQKQQINTKISYK